ncbi:UDP-N-acetylmuramoyl-tripeptide--D-alanyl-D-alanine ligase [Rickettsiales endosymbiont of Paramecium tredecaurelia]|uniref:UDP-N-acetylmuramoyl-tripeptide--D-alanyl-D- alanine ligase n=1 Tax=Candidatus Sarmatiella mevalonica TaxID=2770581 RepID=UPI0019212D7F|nr:UDP-N-acetylmuramoyl-tripeptide--D-alanyl-D-alanine ligase [Candidatus Sarmatiella mevalonica]MBL3285096.1 UDP-N-acetylmuramoyl-tripeptide--D-alanyl-D-alanine ligase [Candidatus Sarmatiella mevalonica]
MSWTTEEILTALDELLVRFFPKPAHDEQMPEAYEAQSRSVHEVHENFEPATQPQLPLGVESIKAHATNSEKHNVIRFNSKLIQNNDIFIAISGGNGDGHLYVDDAISRGASCLIISNEQVFDSLVLSHTNKCIVLVNDAQEALQSLAIYKRSKVPSTTCIIAITGSLGKTSTKEALGQCLSAIDDSTFVSYKNFNNYLGLLINLASLNENAKYMVFELGMNCSGEIAQLSKLLQPNIVIITNIAHVHLAFFQDLRGIASAKAEIFCAHPNIAIINAENEYSTLLHKAKACAVERIYSFGSSQEHGELIGYEALRETGATNDGARVKLTFNILGQTVSFVRDKLPKHFAQNWVALLILAKVLNLDINRFCESLTLFHSSNLRFELCSATFCDIKYSIIADCYNASPTATKCALQYLADFSNKNKIAVLGQMLELGERSKEMHVALREEIVNANLSALILIGDDWYDLYEQLKNYTLLQHLYFFSTSDTSTHKLGEACYSDGWETRVSELLLSIITQDAVVLLKASRSFKFERILDVLRSTIN